MREPADTLITQPQRLHLAVLLTILALVVLVVTTCSSCAMFHGVRRTPQQMHMATITIRTTCPGGGQFYGSGVIVSPTRALTAAHVVRCTLVDGLDLAVAPESVEVDVGDMSWRPVKVTLEDPEADVAAVVSTAFAPYYTRLEIGPLPSTGERVCAATGNMPYAAIKCGPVQPRHPAATADLMFWTVIEPGNSGSGLYDSRGRLIGIVVQLRRCPATMQICAGAATSLWSLRQSLHLR